MNNETYLIVSYFVVFAVACALGVATYFVLRRTVADLTRAARGGRLGQILRRLLLIGLLLPAILGFFSVTYYSCDKDTYEKIIEERSYLVEKNKEQISSTLNYLIGAIYIWGLLVVGFLFAIQKSSPRCPACGQRLPTSDGAPCPHCGAALSDSSS